MIHRAALAFLFVVLLAVPYVGGGYYTILLLPAFGYGIALLGMNLLLGYTGLLSLGQALFVALGAYTAAYMTSRFKILHFEALLLAACLVGVLVAVPLATLCVRYVKIFFGILTLSFSMLFYSFLFKFYRITGGDEGIMVARPYLLGSDLSSMDKIAYLTGPFYYYMVALLVVATVVMYRVTRSPFGLRLRSIRDNAQKAESLGVPVRLHRFLAFVIAGAYGAIAGVAISIPTGLADPGLAFWVHSGNLVFMLLLGGYTNFFGPLLGAFAFIFLQDQLMSLTAHWRFLFGALIAVIVIFVPNGLMGVVDRSRRWAT
jgi:branched-chain amino acid transport system permease protein